MTEVNTFERLRKLVHSCFPDASVQVNEKTVADDVPGWDSAAHVDLIMSIEDEFGIQFNNSEIAAFDNLGELGEMIDHKLAAAK
jgi:acyl carrier protein